jgi:aminotransferase
MKDNFSDLVNNIIEANSIHYNNLVYDLKKKGKDIITLSLGEAFFDIPLLSFDSLPFPDIYHYSHSRGIIGLRKKLSKYFASQYQFSFDPDNEILITAGSKVAIQMSFLAILNKGDEVIIPEPYWVSYTEQVKICGSIPIAMPYYEDVYDIEKYITKNTKCIILNNPHNPTGKIYSKKEIEYLLRIAEKENIYILSDEVYSDFVPDNENFFSMGMFGNKDNVIVANSISKNYGISGWRLGYVITNKNLINQILKLNQHIITCPSTILEYYIEKYFDDILKITKPQIQDVVKERLKVCKYIDSKGLSYSPGSAAWYIFLSIEDSSYDSDQFCTELLKRYYVSCVPGIGYGKSCDKFIRVCVGSESWERITNGIDSIANLIEETRNNDH